MARFVFVSFASPSARIADRLAKALKIARVPVFCTTQDVRGDEVALEKIRKMIEDKECVFVPIYSAEYFDKSRMSLLEYSAFIHKHRLDTKGRMYPIRLDKSEIPTIYEPIQYKQVNSNRITRDLPKIVQEIKGIVNTTPVPVEAVRGSEKTKIAEAGLSIIFKAEWEKILERSQAVNADINSMTQIYLFGWAAVSGLKSRSPNPIIAKQQISIIVSNLFNISPLRDGKNYIAVVGPSKEFISNLCTIRYLIFCSMIASGEKDYNAQLLKYLLDGLKCSKEKRDQYLVEVKDVLKKFVASENIQNTRIQAQRLLRSIGSGAQLLEISLDDIYAEEMSARRYGERRGRMTQVLVDNSVTNEIVLFLKDVPGAYYAVMDALRRLVPFNVIQSTSETLVPQRIAYVNLKVCSRQKELLAKMLDEIEDSKELRELVLNITVNTL